jgi:hypothetical protein
MDDRWKDGDEGGILQNMTARGQNQRLPWDIPLGDLYDSLAPGDFHFIMRGIWRIAAGSRAWVPGCLAHVLVPKSSGRLSLVNCCKPSNQQHQEAGVVGQETGFVGETKRI